MAEWYAEVHSMVPHGMIEERLFICQLDRAADRISILLPGIMKTTAMGGSFPETEFFMSGSPSFGGRSQVDEFLQAIMDLAWKRGLRPSKFDPSAGELAAVKAHLDDMRRLAHVETPKLLQPEDE
jgi:hypothetical protein